MGLTMTDRVRHVLSLLAVLAFGILAVASAAPH